MGDFLWERACTRSFLARSGKASLASNLPQQINTIGKMGAPCLVVCTKRMEISVGGCLQAKGLGGYYAVPPSPLGTRWQAALPQNGKWGGWPHSPHGQANQ